MNSLTQINRWRLHLTQGGTRVVEAATENEAAFGHMVSRVELIGPATGGRELDTILDPAKVRTLIAEGESTFMLDGGDLVCFDCVDPDSDDVLRVADADDIADEIAHQETYEAGQRVACCTVCGDTLAGAGARY